MKVDHVVVGGGIAGVCTAYHLAAQGRETLLIERAAVLAPPNPFSSSGDVTKCFRTMYGGDRHMTRLSKASFEWWRHFQERSGAELFTPCGLVAFGAEEPGALAHWRDREMARCVKQSAPILEAEGLPFDLMSKAEVIERFPLIAPSETYDHALLDKTAGLIDATKAVQAIGELARARGAGIWTGTTAHEILRDGDDVVAVLTSRGRVEVRGSLVLAAGYMNPVLAPELAPKIRVSQQQLFYFRPAETQLYRPERMPIVIDLNTWRYVFPLKDGVVKVADDDNGRDEKVLDPARDPAPRPDQAFEADARRFLGDFVPGLADAAAVEGRACLYTNTVSGQYLMYRHGNTVVVSACSGHGFKNGPLTGLAAARLAVGEQCDWYSDAFRFENAADFPERMPGRVA